MSARHDEITLKKRLMDRSDTIGQRPELRQARTIGNWRGREKQTALLRFPPKTSKKNPRNAKNKSKEESPLSQSLNGSNLSFTLPCFFHWWALCTDIHTYLSLGLLSLFCVSLCPSNRQWNRFELNQTAKPRLNGFNRLGRFGSGLGFC